ncbi:putative bifunctional diguanylate cyclase/phosphodiesterase [Larsenimonas salina]|uniref:putative bifunctional diguanylate cyclase/phosphodiesterase n=1 Tax=Larsenimonas salina TaxID=1295565 RepID=UPI0020733A22|nr:GGDEF domain-containing phosphodiesterase [Larsenimonas salina]MCM5703311.1 EAL domain-containing protein [Larsenimonas salina]
MDTLAHSIPPTPADYKARFLIAAQRDYTRGSTLFSAAAQVFCALIMLFVPGVNGETGLLPLWAAAICTLSITLLLLQRRWQNWDHKLFERAFFIYSLLLAACWAALPVVTFPGTSPDLQVFISLAIAGVIGAGSFTRAAYPKVFATWIAVICTGCAIAISMMPEKLLWHFLLIVCCYCLVISVISYKLFKTLQARSHSEAELAHRNEFMGVLLNELEHSLSDWLWETDARFTLTHISPRLMRVTRMNEQELAARPVTELVREFACNESYQELTECVRARKPFSRVVVRFDLKGSSHWWEITGKPSFDDSGRFIGYRGVCSDVTARQRASLGMAYLAEHDSLTGLKNRSWFLQYLQVQTQKDAQAPPPKRLALMIVDIDNFKPINDHYGHSFGDKFLVRFSERLQSALGGWTSHAVRLGGDEFAIILHVTDLEEARAFSQTLFTQFLTPLSVYQHAIKAQFSIGLALLPRGEHTTPQHLILNADIAMYEAKRLGGQTLVNFDQALGERISERQTLIHDLKAALDTDQLSLYLQPIVEASKQSIDHYEALLRWKHPSRGMIGPDIFIPLAEETGLIHPLGNFVIKQACTLLAALPETQGLAINLSAHQLVDPALYSNVTEALLEANVSPSRLTLEVTESALMQNATEAKILLERFHALGVSLALDDFGTGYSSLAYLNLFPFDTLKIDRSFVKQLGSVKDSQPIISTIILLARELDLRVTAEGVETEAQAILLNELGCHALQGYYFGRPSPLEDLALPLTH